MTDINKDGIGSFEVNLTTKTVLPDIKYINELARDRNLIFDTQAFQKAPALLEDLYYIYRQEREDPENFKIEDYIFSKDLIVQTLNRPLNTSEEAYYDSTLEFLSNQSYTNCPGRTPMDKALNTIMYLVKLTEDTNVNSPKQTTIDANSLQNSMDKLDQQGVQGDGSDGESSSNDNNGQEMSKDVISCVRDHLYDLSPSIANVLGEDYLIDVPVNNELLKLIDLKSYLEEKVDLSTSTDVKVVKNNSSNQKKIYQMDSYAKVSKVGHIQRVLPNFDNKFIKKELTVREKVKPEEKKQMLVILLDDSGSMNCHVKQAHVRAFIMNRLESVCEGKSKVLFYNFESSLYNKMEATDVESSAKLYKFVVKKRPNGGGTNVGSCLQSVINDIHNIPGHHHPEILIINDGDDHVDHANIDLKGVRINAAIFGRDNEGMKAVCVKSKGFYIAQDLYKKDYKYNQSKFKHSNLFRGY